MKTSSLLRLLSVGVGGWSLVLSATAAPQVTFQPAAGKVGCYDFHEVTLLVAGSTAANPFTDASVTGSFTPPGGEALAVDGFCDAPDGAVHRIRFMPARPGVHPYRITYREGTVEQTYEGAFEAVESKRKGVLRVDPEHPWHFQWDGSKERFYWNGTTAYWLAGWDDATIRASLDRWDRFKVTRVRVALNGRVRDGRAWFENVFPTPQFSFLLNPWVARDPASVEQPGFDVTRFNVAHWQKFESLVRHAGSREMIVSVIFYVDGSRPGVDPFGRAAMGGPDEQRYYRYAIARLAPFANVMWDLANEYRHFRDDAWAEKMGAFVKATDPYDHLTSTHGHGDFRFRTSPWADFAMYQSWDEHGGYEFMLKNRQEQEKTGRLMPQVNEEYGYEEHYPQGWGENRVAPARSAPSRVRLAWEMAFAGAYQTTGERADRGTGWGPDTGGGWINGRGDASMTLPEQQAPLYDFFTSLTWWTLVPAPELVTSFQPLAKPGPAAGEAASPPRALALRNAEGDLAAVYLGAGGTVTLKGDLLKDGLRPLWFSPRDGGTRVARALRPRVYRTPDAAEWVLVLRTPCNCSFREYDEEWNR